LGPAWSGELLVAGCLRPWAERLVDVVSPHPGERCIDVLSDGTVLARLLRRAVGSQGSVSVLGDDNTTLRAHHGAADIVVSLFGLAHAASAPTPLVAMHESLAAPGRLACVVWGGRDGAVHETAVFDAVAATTGVRLDFISAASALGEPGAAEAVIDAAEMRHSVRPRRLRDVVRFDGIDHLWAALVDQRPQVSVTLGACSSEALHSARSRCAESLNAYTAADGTLRIPVEAVLIETATGAISRRS
jgi:hypothetical protein